MLEFGYDESVHACREMRGGAGAKSFVARGKHAYGKRVVAVQRFMAELSNLIVKSDFETLWNSERPGNAVPKVEFAFAGRTISATVHSELSSQWPSANFRQVVSAVIRQLDRACNIRWL